MRPGLALGVAAAIAAGGTAAAGPAKKEMVAGGEEPAAYDKARWEKELRRRVGKKPPALINVHYTWTDETVAFDAGGKQMPTQAMVNHFLRCHFTNHEKDMDLRVFKAMLDAANHFKVGRVDIVSGYRAPKYNLILRKKGRYVARNSHHTIGHAVDFRLPGVTTERLRDWARRLRLGGVGYYPGDGFVHVDVGPIRYWTDAE